MSKTSIASPLRVGAASLLAAALAGAGCAKQTAAGLVRESIPVTVGTASRQDVPVEVRAIGHVEPYSTVSVKARVAGEVTKVGFREGQDVRKGDLLFQIDPRPYEASLAQARAQLERDRAVAKNAEDQIRRYADLVQKDYVTKEEYERMTAGAEAAKATAAADRAAVENARLQLSDLATRCRDETLNDSAPADKPPVMLLDLVHDRVGVLLHLARQRFP